MITRITTTTATAIIMFLFLSGPSNMAIAPSFLTCSLIAIPGTRPLSDQARKEHSGAGWDSAAAVVNVRAEEPANRLPGLTE
jgi:hypothetical protein